MPVAKLFRTSLPRLRKCLIINILRDFQPSSFELHSVPRLSAVAPDDNLCRSFSTITDTSQAPEKSGFIHHLHPKRTQK